MKMNAFGTKVLLGLLVVTLPAHATTPCDISEQMRQTQNIERQRRLQGIDRRFEDIMRINDLERACLENFPGYPTQLPSTGILLAAFGQIKRNACRTVSQNVQNVQQEVQSGIDQNIMRQIQGQIYNQAQGQVQGQISNIIVDNVSRNVSQELPQQGNELLERLRRLFQ